MDKANCLKLLGIDIWRERKDSPSTETQIKVASSLDQPATKQADNTKDNWETLYQRVSSCTACDLHKNRTQTVFGVGSHQADLMIVGEAPGYNEDKQGKPFVGRAGQLLTNMLAAINIARDDVFIANVLKCRPPNNRDPKPEEVTQCTHFLLQQIELIQPKVILAVGRIAAHFLLKTNIPLGRMRGRVFTYGKQQTPLLVTYHPAYLLRSPREKGKAYEDLLFLKQTLTDLDP